MLNTLKARLPEGLDVKKVKEKPSKYEITFLIDGRDIKGELPKTCTPGCQNSVADLTIFNVMARNAMNNGDMETAKMWLDKALPRRYE